jgi:Copper type II ascorbate-dependent monooxygenase, C-terminal domain
MNNTTLTLRSSLFAATVLLAIHVGCGDNTGSADQPDAVPPVVNLLDPPAPGTGFQVSLTTKIPAGEEHEYCRFVKAPESWAVRDEVRFSPGSHHVLLYSTPYAAIPTTKEDGTPLVVDANGVFDCTEGATNGIRVSAVTGGSQNRNGDSILKFPEGVAVKTTPILLINAHYINATDNALEPTAAINVYTVDQSKVQVEGGMLFLYQPFIHVPSMGKSTARWSCPVNSNIKVANLQSHMHARGVGYKAELVSANGQTRSMLYETSNWESVPTKNYPGIGLEVAKGSRFDYQCNYDNTQAREVFQGAKASDEMCMLIGSYYPRDDKTAQCVNEAGTALAGEWIGSGAKTCAETLGCIQAELNDNNIARCIQQSKPAVSKVMSAALNCFISTADPETECATQIDACAAQ